MCFGEVLDSGGDLIESPVVQARHRIIEHQGCLGSPHATLGEEVRQGEDLLLALGEYGRWLVRCHGLLALGLPAPSLESKSDVRRAQSSALLSEQGLEVLVDKVFACELRLHGQLFGGTIRDHTGELFELLRALGTSNILAR